VEVRAVAQVLEHVRRLRKRCLSNPGSALASHLREGMSLAIWHPRGHVVTANTAERMTPLRHFSGCVVRAAGTEMWHTLDSVTRQCQRALFLFDPANALIHRIGLIEALDSAGNR